MKDRKILYFGMGVIAILITAFVGFRDVPIGLILFTISPYFGLLYLVKTAKHATALVTAKVMTLFVVSVGLYFLLDTTYMEKNLEYKFSFLFIPLWQWAMLLVSGFVVLLSNRDNES